MLFQGTRVGPARRCVSGVCGGRSGGRWTYAAVVGAELVLFEDHLVAVCLERWWGTGSFGEDECRVLGITL